MARKESTLRWGVLGTARIARVLVPVINATPGCRVEAVASRDPERAQAFAATMGIPKTFPGYAAMLRSGAVDVVYNALPNSLHATWTLRALEAGLPVLCEKPFTATLDEARQVAEMAARTGLPVAEALMYRFHPVYDRIFEAIWRGRIGTITTVASRFTFRLEDRSEIPASAELAGGALMDVGCYCVDLSRRMAATEPKRAFAFERRTTVDDTMFGQLEFPNGIVAQFECSIENHERHRAEIAGTDGAIWIDEPWFPGEDKGRFVIRREGRESVIETPGGNGYALEVRDFADACLGRGTLRWGAQDAVANMAAIEALYTSAREGTAVEVAGP